MTAVALCVFVWLLSPVAIEHYFLLELARGAYPPDADSIGIPIFGYVLLWLWFTPAMLILLGAALWRSTGRASLLAWDRSRPVRSNAWTILFGLIAAYNVADAIQYARASHWLNVAHGLLSAVAVLMLRAIAVGPRPGPAAQATVLSATG